jgi:hypothetical protein
MLLASDALSKFDGSTAPPTSPAQQPETHPTPPTPTPSAALATEPASPVVPPQPAAAAVTPVAEPRAKETPPQGGSIEKKEEVRQEEPQAAATTTTNLNSAKAEAKLVKALDYLVSLSTITPTTPAEKWFINESILASLTGCFRPAISHNRGKSKDQPRPDPSFGQELQKGCPRPALLTLFKTLQNDAETMKKP